MPERFHQQQYYIAAILFLACLLLYCYAPNTKSETLAALAAAFGGFITGKFSNGFRKPGDGGSAYSDTTNNATNGTGGK